MPAQEKVKLLVNLPEGFFQAPQLKPLFKRLGEYSTIRRRSWNTPEEIHKDAAWAQAVVMWAWPTLTPEILRDARELQIVCHLNASRKSAENLLEAGVTVSEARHGWSPAVAEMALTLVLAGLRKTSEYHMRMRQGTEKWVNAFPTDIDPIERQLTGRSVGVVGFGAIGQRLAELLAPFQVSLRVFDPHLPDKIAKAKGGNKVELKELVKESEIVVLCAANTGETKHLMDKKMINALQKNAVLVNVGRSSLIDMNALIERLKKGDLVAMLDVFDKEPLEKDSPLRHMDNAYLTPHRAGAPMESVVRILTMAVEDLEAFLKGKKLKYALTKEMFKNIP
jgi:phosphoglycerate dehydrogenase-like enzyme